VREVDPAVGVNVTARRQRIERRARENDDVRLLAARQPIGNGRGRVTH
jgi:hypothetical protein